MKFSRKGDADSGSAAIELLGFGILLQIPILIFAVTVAQVQHRGFAAEAIARNAVRSFVLLNDMDHTGRVIEELAQSYSVIPGDLSWQARCQPNPNCQAERGSITISVRYGDQVAVGYSVY